MRNRLLNFFRFRFTFIFTVSCLVISSVIIMLSRLVDGFAQWYAVRLYPIFLNMIGRVFTHWEHSWFEVGIISLTGLIIIFSVSGIILAIIRRNLLKTYRSCTTRIMICLASGLILIYSIACGVNYQRDGIITVLKLPQQEISKEKLKELNLILAEEITELTSDPDWDYSILALKDTAYIEIESINSMKQLGKIEPSLSGYYPDPKQIYFSEALSGLGIEGIFSPFTMEANYNKDMTPFLIPYTICHELAHLKGYMKEEDAGFIAYLACKNSPSLIFQYSGSFHALIFTLNALKAEVTPEEFNEIYARIPKPVQSQLSFVRAQSVVNETRFTSMTKKINNAYLKVNAQSGTKSYSLIVDLLLAEYADQLEDENLL